MTTGPELVNHSNYLFFEVGEARFCAPVDEVQAIVELSEIHALPFSPKGVTGTVLFRERIAVVCDLSRVLDGEQGIAEQKNLSVVVGLPIGLVAFRVDRVSDIVPGNTIRPQVADRRALKEWMDGYVMQGPHIAFLTNFEKLLGLFGISHFTELVQGAPEAQEPHAPSQAQPLAVGMARAAEKTEESRGQASVTAAQPPAADSDARDDAGELPGGARERSAAESIGVHAAEVRSASLIENPADLAAGAIAAATVGGEASVAPDAQTFTAAAGSRVLYGDELSEATDAALDPPAEAGLAPARPAVQEVEDRLAVEDRLTPAGSLEEAASAADAGYDLSTGRSMPDSAPAVGATAFATDSGNVEVADAEAEFAGDRRCTAFAEPGGIEAREFSALAEDAREAQEAEILAVPADAAVGPGDEAHAWTGGESDSVFEADRDPEPSGEQDRAEEFQVNSARVDAFAETADSNGYATSNLSEQLSQQAEPAPGTSAFDARDSSDEQAPGSEAGEPVEPADAWPADRGDANSHWQWAPPKRADQDAPRADERRRVGVTASPISSGERGGLRRQVEEVRGGGTRGHATVSGNRVVISTRRPWRGILVLLLLVLVLAGGWWLAKPDATPPQAGRSTPAPLKTAVAPPPTEPVPARESASDKIEIKGKNFEMRVERGHQESGGRPLSMTPGSPDEIVHLVRRGDTLWDIAAKYLGNPFRYPELARNSAIHNPNLINPGDVVRIKKRR